MEIGVSVCVDFAAVLVGRRVLTNALVDFLVDRAVGFLVDRKVDFLRAVFLVDFLVDALIDNAINFLAESAASLVDLLTSEVVVSASTSCAAFCAALQGETRRTGFAWSMLIASQSPAKPAQAIYGSFQVLVRECRRIRKV